MKSFASPSFFRAFDMLVSSTDRNLDPIAVVD